MHEPSLTDAEREEQLNEILLSFVEALENGQPPDRRQFLAEHPEFAAELAEFFAGRDHMERLASPLRQAGRVGNFAESPSGDHVLFSPGRIEPADDPARQSSDAGLGQLGDFRLLREVGRGGMGIVYEAQQLSLNRRVALKVLPFAAALDPRQLQRFKNEAQAAALLHHNNIVPVHAVGCERGVHYYAMQFIEGQSLAALLAELRQSSGEQAASDVSSTLVRAPAVPPFPTGRDHTVAWSPSETAPSTQDTVSPAAVTISTERSTRRSTFFRRVAVLGKTAAQALEHAHQMGVIHRDIKPANVLLDGRGNLWITDFGLALLQSTGGLTTTGELVGTLRYMSPEQTKANSGLVDHRTDVYSLGVTLYELLTLEPVFAGNDRHRLLDQVAFEEPRTPRSIDRSIPVELETIVLKTLAKNPSERYATAQQLADDLGRFLEDQPIRARRPTLLDRATKWSRRHKSLVASALLLLLTLTAGLLISTLLIAKAHSDATAAYEREREKAKEAQEQRARAEANFLQAWQAVDFLTQVSEEELIDKPEVLEVRRTLLEGALQYYQEFLEQRQDDPSVQAKLAASRARVAQILDELSAQQEYFQLMLLVALLTEREVQQDLQATEGQQARIASLSQQLSEQRHNTFRTFRELPREEQGKKFIEMAAANEQAISEVLKPPQLGRLKQIALQQRGPEAFSRPQVVKVLGLTKDQQEQIQLLQEASQRSARPDRHHRRGDRGAAREQMQQARNLAMEQMLALLTPSQQAAWQTLAGEPFQGRISFSHEGGPGHHRPGGRD